MRYKALHKSEYKFVEWSSSVSEKNVDVQWIAGYLNAKALPQVNILDVGGGNGKFAESLSRLVSNTSIDVIDPSRVAKEHFTDSKSVRLITGDFLEETLPDKYDVIVFRTVLHHFISTNDAKTYQRQLSALKKARESLRPNGAVFMTENFFEPLVGNDISGRLIFELTKSHIIAPIIRKLGANTAGEGVRFRSYKSWLSMIKIAGFHEIDGITNSQWRSSKWKILPFMCRSCFQRTLRIEPA